MKLRTSFFNFRVLRKNLARFAPVWVLYAIAEVLALMLLDLKSPYYIIAGDLVQCMGPTAIFHAGYAFIVAACLFGDLFDSRMCNGLHAMPMRREGWLLTNLVSGLVFALIPAIVGGGVAALFLEQQWWIALIWQGVSLLQFVFFFGLAVFCAMCTGKRLGMMAMYGILNFLSMLVYWIADRIYEPMITGVMISDYWFAKLCPLVSIMGSEYLHYLYDVFKGTSCTVVTESFTYLFICAAIGVVLTFFAWGLYRKRSLEKAGDFVAFRPMGMFFLLSYTFVLGIFLHSFGELFGWYQNYIFLLVGILIGWFTGWMLLERTVKIFTKKVWIGLLVFLVVFAGSLFATAMDPFGLSTYIPEKDEIATANLYLPQDIFYYDSGEDVGENGWQITDPEEIEKIRQVHQSMLEVAVGTGGMEDQRSYSSDRLKYMLGSMNGAEEEYLTTYVRYHLKNGMEVQRTYAIPKNSAAMAALNPLFSDFRSVFTVSDPQKVKDTLHDVVIYYANGADYVEFSDHAQKQALLAAIEADCKAGTMAQHDYFHTSDEIGASLEITWSEVVKDGNAGEISEIRGSHLIIYTDAVNTMAFLKTLTQ